MGNPNENFPGGQSPQNPPAYLDVSVHYLRAVYKLGPNSDRPVALRINGEKVRVGASGGRIPVASRIPLRVTSDSSFSRGVELYLEPGQIAPLYYSNSLQKNVPAVVSLTPFAETPGTSLLRTILLIWLFMMLSAIPVVLFVVFVIRAMMN